MRTIDNINCIFINIIMYFLHGFVSPNLTYGVPGLPPTFSFLRNNFLCSLPFQSTFSEYVVLLPISENNKWTRNEIPCRTQFDFRPELSSRPDWWPRRCPIIVEILCMFGTSGTVPTYGIAYIRYCTYQIISEAICAYVYSSHNTF